MPAYSVELQTKCATPGCRSRKATHEVRDRWNGLRGIYCKRCADRLVKYLNEPDRVVTQ